MNSLLRSTRRSRTDRVRLWAAAPLVVAAVALTGCGTSDINLSQQLEPAARVSASTPGTHVYGYTGQAAVVTVPEGVVAVGLEVVGAGGGEPNRSVRGDRTQSVGRGMKIVGQVPVVAGDQLTLGVGGQGAIPVDENQAPGPGGWGLRAEWAGGPGGRGYGGLGDGSGGGGASAVLLNDEPVVVAAGGGGAGGERSPALGDHVHLGGGDGGDTVGQDGDHFSGELVYGGRGAGPDRLHNNPKGQDGIAEQKNAAGGGGGGGGYHPGQGGYATVMGGDGGGGGMSYRDGLTTTGWTNVKDPAAGSISLTWITDGRLITPSIDLHTTGATLTPHLDGTPLSATLPDDATGTVTFVASRGGRPFELDTVPVARGTAQLTSLTEPLAAGAVEVSALYSGDGVYTSRQSEPAALTVAMPTPALGLTVGNNTKGIAFATGKDIVPLTASLPADATGQVTFTYTGALDASITGTLGTADVDHGTATLTEVRTILAKGGYTITATYTGDEEFAAATRDASIGILK